MKIPNKLEQAEKVKIHPGFHNLLAGLENIPDGHWMMYFNDDMHWSGMTNRTLAEKLSLGENYPARPALAQFGEKWAAKITEMMAGEIVLSFHNVTRDKLGRFGKRKEPPTRVIAYKLIALFQDFVLGGNVTPGNAPYTIAKKGFDKPWVEKGDLITDGIVCEYVDRKMPDREDQSCRIDHLPLMYQ